MLTRRLQALTFLAAALAWTRPSTAADGTAATNAILDTTSFWRVRAVRETPELALPSGEIRHARIDAQGVHAYFQKNPGAIEAPAEAYKVVELDPVRLPAETAPDWFAPGFDDSSWARVRGPMLDKSIQAEWKLILVRGLFEVSDPAHAGDLTLSLTFRGGAVVYLNGEEIARAQMPAGAAGLHAPAEPYSPEEYFTAEGFLFYRYEKSADAAPRIARRIRRLAEVRIPAARLRKGVNVLAVANHRAPTLAAVYLRHLKGSYASHDDVGWAKIGLSEIRLTARPAAAVVPNVGLVAGRGFKVWNQSAIQKVFVPDYPDPFSPLSPIRMTGIRNGTFAGQVIVGDDRPIRGLRAEVSDLAGPAAIPASAVTVRYALADGRGSPAFFDSLEDAPPDEVPHYPDHGGALQPIWITVAVPPAARPGDYRGAVTIRAEGVRPVSVPINLRVIDWSLPPVSRYTATMDVIESPESVAMAYDVPLWSDAHLRLLDRTFALLAPLGAKTLYITCIRRTHFGNEHAMVRWIRGEDGELTPEFSIVEKYLDVATRHLGPVPGVILYCWEPPESQGHAGGAGTAGRTYDKPILITTFDPQSGAQAARHGPAWGTPEAQAFWKRLADGIRPVLAKRGLADSMLFGLIGDTRPTKQAMTDISAGVPDGQWAIHSHFYCDVWHGHKIGYAIALWGIGVMPADPSAGYSFGWSNPFWLAYYPREMSMQSTLVEHRVKLENWMAARRGNTPFVATGVGPRGLGRIGGDFWDVARDMRGRNRGSLAGRYPEAAWGQLNLNYCVPYVLGRGRAGAVPTVRSEALREALQEVETRIYVEKALFDDEAAALLGDGLRARCRAALDERIRMCLHAGGEGEPWFISSDWNGRTERLFTLAAEIAGKLGREPIPNLSMEAERKP